MPEVPTASEINPLWLAAMWAAFGGVAWTIARGGPRRRWAPLFALLGPLGMLAAALAEARSSETPEGDDDRPA